MVKKFAKFILVGIANSLFGYSVYAIFIYFRVHYSLAVLMATLLGIAFNFRTIGGLVFNNKDRKHIFRFAGVYAITYALQVAALMMFDSYQVNLYSAGLVLAAPLAIISFVLNSKFVFREGS